MPDSSWQFSQPHTEVGVGELCQPDGGGGRGSSGARRELEGLRCQVQGKRLLPGVPSPPPGQLRRDHVQCFPLLGNGLSGSC